MLFTYMRRVQRLIRDTRQQLINPADLIDYVNEARSQLAGESECIRYLGSLALTMGTRVYPFSAITLPGGAGAGVQGILNVRTAWYQIGTGQVWFRPRAFEWFSIYELNSAAPSSGPPYAWAQFAQGASGSIYISPLPNIAYTLSLDCVCYPIALVDDTTVEAIPFLWTDAVAYYATYLAMLAMETGAATDEAQKMFAR